MKKKELEYVINKLELLEENENSRTKGFLEKNFPSKFPSKENKNYITEKENYELEKELIELEVEDAIDFSDNEREVLEPFLKFFNIEFSRLAGYNEIKRLIKNSDPLTIIIAKRLAQKVAWATKEGNSNNNSYTETKYLIDMFEDVFIDKMNKEDRSSLLSSADLVINNIFSNNTRGLGSNMKSIAKQYLTYLEKNQLYGEFIEDYNNISKVQNEILRSFKLNIHDNYFTQDIDYEKNLELAKKYTLHTFSSSRGATYCKNCGALDTDNVKFCKKNKGHSYLMQKTSNGWLPVCKTCSQHKEQSHEKCNHLT